jgi:hypothetical protein
MQNSIKRIFKPQATQVAVQVKITRDEVQPGSVPDCEVKEFEGLDGWKAWEDSLFVQDFEDSLITAPAPLYVDSKPGSDSQKELLAPFGYATKSPT